LRGTSSSKILSSESPCAFKSSKSLIAKGRSGLESLLYRWT
jgi:hypothetical protein